MLVGTSDSVEFKNAPIFLKEELTFPYRYGLDFETELLRAAGKRKPLPRLLPIRREPRAKSWSRKTYLSGESLEPMRLPDFQAGLQELRTLRCGSDR